MSTQPLMPSMPVEAGLFAGPASDALMPVLGPQARETTFRWATVTQADPALRVMLDGDTVAIDRTPYVLAPTPPPVGARVWCQLFGRRIIVLGAASTALGPVIDTGWVDLVLENGWQNYGGGYAVVAVRRVNGIVFLKGLVRNGTPGTVITTLPSGFWPESVRLFPGPVSSVTSGAASAGTAHTHATAMIATRIDVGADGKVTQYGTLAASSSWIDLSTVSYPLPGLVTAGSGLPGTADTGWVTVPITNTTNFGPYDGTDADQPRVRKINNAVWLRGALVNKVAGAVDGTTHVVICTLPTAYRPAYARDLTFTCQASGTSRWALNVRQVDGTLTANRCGPIASSTSTWLPFNVSWLVD